MSSIFHDQLPPLPPPPNRMLCPVCERMEDANGQIVHPHTCPLRGMEARRRAITAHAVAIDFPGPALARGAWEVITEHADKERRGRGMTCGWVRVQSADGRWWVVIVGEDMAPIRDFTALAHGFGGHLNEDPPAGLIVACKMRRWRTIVDASIAGDPTDITVRNQPSRVDFRGGIHRQTGGQG
jgi:hypothetical protein